jgi:hypothetical protein
MDSKEVEKIISDCRTHVAATHELDLFFNSTYMSLVMEVVNCFHSGELSYSEKEKISITIRKQRDTIIPLLRYGLDDLARAVVYLADSPSYKQEKSYE